MNESNERGQHALGLRLDHQAASVNRLARDAPSHLDLVSDPVLAFPLGGRGGARKQVRALGGLRPLVTSQAARESRPVSLPWDRAWKGTRQSRLRPLSWAWRCYITRRRVPRNVTGRPGQAEDNGQGAPLPPGAWKWQGRPLF